MLAESIGTIVCRWSSSIVVKCGTHRPREPMRTNLDEKYDDSRQDAP
jgi:hypothetical protein